MFILKYNYNIFHVSVRSSLHNYKDKVKRLEEKLAQILADKNLKIKELEAHISELLQSKVYTGHHVRYISAY